MGKWIAAQLNVMAVTYFIPHSAGSPTQCLNHVGYLPIHVCNVDCSEIIHSNICAFDCLLFTSYLLTTLHILPPHSCKVPLVDCCFTSQQHLRSHKDRCHSAHSWWLYNTNLLGNQATSTVTWYPTQSNFPDAEQTGPYPILIMQRAWLGSDNYQF